MNRLQSALAVSVVLSLAACAKANDGPIDTTVASNPRVETAVVPAASSTKPTPPAQWVVTEYGIGRLRAGMTVSEARAAFPSFKLPRGADSTGCNYATIDGLPAGVSVMVDGGKVGRVDVIRGDVATSAGARIGDTEDRVKTLYPGRVSVSPHKYTDGHYLTVAPGAKADSAFRIVFETDGKRVLRYRGGIRPQVEYVEGCS